MFEVAINEGGSHPDLAKRPKHYRVEVTGAAELRARLVRTNGEPEGPGALLKVETIASLSTESKPGPTVAMRASIPFDTPLYNQRRLY
jgi:hypothetical protein